jgi:hypothetical protein
MKEFVGAEAMRYIENNRHRFTSETMARYLQLKVRTVKRIVQNMNHERHNDDIKNAQSGRYHPPVSSQ